MPMKSSKKQISLNETTSKRFKFVRETTVRKDYIEISRSQAATLRTQLPKGIYWIQPTGRVVLWNWVLLNDYLVNGDRPDHQALVEEYLSTLPQSA
jgi:hypothetical protein